MRCCRSRPGWRGTRTTRRRACWADSSSRGIPTGGFDAVRLDAHPGDRAGGARSRRSSRPPRRPEGCCPTGPARGRRVHRQPRRACRSAPSPSARTCCCPPPRTGCTRSTGARPIPESAALVDALRAAGVPAVISGAGPTVLALTTDGDAAVRARPARFHRAARCRSTRSASPSRSRACPWRDGVVDTACGWLLPPQTDTSTLGGATAIHASSAWPLEPGQDLHCPQTARAALPRNRDDRRPARSGRLPTPRSTRQSSGTPSGRA